MSFIASVEKIEKILTLLKGNFLKTFELSAKKNKTRLIATEFIFNIVFTYLPSYMPFFQSEQNSFYVTPNAEHSFSTWRSSQKWNERCHNFTRQQATVLWAFLRERPTPSTFLPSLALRHISFPALNRCPAVHQAILLVLFTWNETQKVTRKVVN